MNIFDTVYSVFSNDMAIDLGTANTLIYMKGKGIVLNEPSVVAIYKNGGKHDRVLAVGTDAKKMIGRTPVNIHTNRPMRDGVIADFKFAGIMLRHFIQKVCSKLKFLKPRIIVAVPAGITPVEKRAVEESAECAGARDVYLIEEPMAAAIGAELPVTEPECSMIVDIGGGTTEVAVISLSGIVVSKSLRVAGDKMDNAIMQYIRRKYNMLIGEGTAEKLKIAIGNAYPDARNLKSINVKGKEIASGKPRILSINSEDIRMAISEPVDAIVEAVRNVLEKTPPELAADIISRGLVLTGGVALLKNLDKLLAEEMRIPVRVANVPLQTVALGSGKTLQDMNILRYVSL